MSYRALVTFFAESELLPIPVDHVIDWVRENTDHKDITLHEVARSKKAYRGAFRRRAVSTGGVYSADYTIKTDIIFGQDLPQDWKRLVIVKELLHVFDPEPARVTTPEMVRNLIPSIILPDFKDPMLAPALNDKIGALKALAVLLPKASRLKLDTAVKAGTRTVPEVARFVQIPDPYVGVWLEHGNDIEQAFCRSD